MSHFTRQNPGLAKTAIRGGVAALVAVCLVVAIVAVKDMVTGHGEPEVTSSFVTEKLEECSDLTSAELTYRGLIQFKDGDIPFLTQKAFQMLYTADVSAGIDLSQVQVEVDRAQVRISLPPVEVREPVVDPSSIEFFDEQKALFNWETKADAVDAVRYAQEDVLAHGDVDALKAKAKSQAETLVRGLFEGVIGGRELVVSFREAPEGGERHRLARAA